MPWLYCPDEALNTSTGECSDPHWIQQSPLGLPPLTGTEGSQIAFAIVGAWSLGYAAWLSTRAIRNRS
jgi:hypothetical protein